MIVTVEPDAEPADIQRALAGRGFWVRRLTAEDGVRFYVEPGSARVDADALRGIRGVASVAREGAALSDEAQALPLDQFAELAREIRSERGA